MPHRPDDILHQFKKLESQKEHMLHQLSTLSRDQLQQQPNPSSWSLSQIAHHLYLSERNSLAYLKKKLTYPDTVPPYHPKSWGGILLIKFVFFTRYKIKAPDAINMWRVDHVMEYEELKEKWDALRRDLIAFIQKNEPVFGRHLAFRHPFAGRMTMYQMLIFLNDHMRHHRRQMHRILRRLPGHMAAQ